MIRWMLVIFLALVLISGFSPLLHKLGFGRLPGDLRPISITLGVQKWAEGSCLIKLGGTEVVCAASSTSTAATAAPNVIEPSAVMSGKLKTRKEM